MTYVAPHPPAPAPPVGKTKKPLAKRWWFWTVMALVVIGIIANATGNHSNKNHNSSAAATKPATSALSTGPGNTAAPAAPAPATPAPATPPPPAPKATTPPVPTRTVQGTATTLGAGNFTGGKDVAPGLYDVTAGPGQSGNFTVNGTDSYNEILGTSDGMGVPEVRVHISNGDQIQISGLSQATFTPVSTPLVTTQAPVTLYAGTWTVGQDLGPGRYTATPGAGQSGNFVIDKEGVNEILGTSDGMGVPNVTFNAQNGDVVTISGLSQVTLTPS
jgi:hypothetical protein